MACTRELDSPANKEEVIEMLRLFRQPVPKVMLGLLAAVIVFGGGTSLVSQDFRDYV